MDQPLTRGAIEKLGRGKPGLGGRIGRLGMLESRPQSGTLRTVAHGRRARLTHVLLGGSDIRHEEILQKTREIRGIREAWNLELEGTKVKAR